MISDHERRNLAYQFNDVLASGEAPASVVLSQGKAMHSTIVGEPCEWRPETLAELRAIVQGKCEGLSYSLNTIAKGTHMGVMGAQWQAERKAYADCLTLIDTLRATQTRTHKRHWFMRMTDALSFSSPHERF